MDTQPSDSLQNRLPNKKILIIILGVLLIILILIVVILQLRKKSQENIDKNISIAPTGRSTGISTGRSTGTSTGTLTKTSILLTGTAKNLSTTLGQKKIQSLDINEETQTEQYLQIAENVLNWLNSMKDERGAYMLGLLCDDKKKCETPVKDNRAGLPVLWGRLKFYEATNKKSELDILNNDLLTYANTITPIQNNFLNCKLMYELNKSNLLTSQQQLNAKKICDKSQHDLEALITISDKIKANIDYEKELTQITANPNSNLVLSQDLGSNYNDKLVDYSVAASDFVYRYYWSKNTFDLKTAAFFYNFALNLYNIKQLNNNFFQGRWLLASASLDLFKATNKTIYKNTINNLIKDDKEKESCSTLFDCVTKSYFYHEYYKLTKDSKFMDLRDRLIRKIIVMSYDDSGYDGYFLGKHSFRSFESNMKTYLTRDNGLIVGLLSYFIK